MQAPGSVFEALEERIRILLPEEYQDCYDDVQPTSMGSAGLKFGSDGLVEWDEMWATFCDLAMAGGPPHKGSLLLPGTAEEIAAQPDRYAEVVSEICRGITLVTSLEASPSPDDGWVRVECENEAMAGWLLRAITMENVSVRADGEMLFLPSGPGYRLEKEIKNVITVIAKTCHYWSDHMWLRQQRAIGELFRTMEAERSLVRPAEADASGIANEIQQLTGLTRAGHPYADWLGLECAEVRSAIWMMRALVASNVLARREGTVLYVPARAEAVRPVAQVHEFARARSIV